MKNVIVLKFEFEREAFEPITDKQWQSLGELLEQESFDDAWTSIWNFFQEKLAEIKEGE